MRELFSDARMREYAPRFCILICSFAIISAQFREFLVHFCSRHAAWIPDIVWRDREPVSFESPRTVYYRRHSLTIPSENFAYPQPCPPGTKWSVRVRENCCNALLSALCSGDAQGPETLCFVRDDHSDFPKGGCIRLPPHPSRPFPRGDWPMKFAHRP